MYIFVHTLNALIKRLPKSQRSIFEGIDIGRLFFEYLYTATRKILESQRYSPFTQALSLADRLFRMSTVPPPTCRVTPYTFPP